MEKMIPVGYMAKRVETKVWWKTDRVKDIYSVSGCLSKFFCDYINYWKHNGFWFFDSPCIIQDLAISEDIDLEGTTLFYYECYELQYDLEHGKWISFEPEKSLQTNVVIPNEKQLHGYDIVSFSVQTNPECSPLSCNGLAERVATNEHCLVESFDEAKQLLETSEAKDCERGPYRIFAVYGIKEPNPSPHTTA